MKLGLLVVLAVAVLVPSLSESRTVSTCELREKLMERFVLPERYQDLKDPIVKVVICNLKWRTHLKTDKIRVIGHLRKTTTTTTPVPTTPVTTKPTVNGSATAKPATNKTMATNPVTTKPTTTESATAKPTANKTMATNPVATNSTSRATRSNQTTPELGNKRRKREADITSQKSDSNTGGSLEELLNEEQVKFDEEELWEDDNRMEDEDNENDEGVEEQELDDGGKREKRFLLRGKGRRRKEKPWSLGHYGIFALTDSHFCESGYRWSRNACNTSCSAFMDEDISDDCDCAMKTHFWLPLYWSAPRRCRRVSIEKFFKGCD